MMLILGAIRQLDQVCEQILTLFGLPTIKTLIRRYSEYPVGKQDLERIVTWIDHRVPIVKNRAAQ